MAILKIAVLSASSGSLILLIAAYCLRERILESYWISKLRSEEPAARIEAAGRLGKIGSAWAAEALLQKIESAGEGPMRSFMK